MARTYPAAWPQIAEHVKARAGWQCERCGAPNDAASGHVLTVAHLDHRYGEQRFNLAALCQRCHCKYEHRFQWEQGYLFEHSAWLQPHFEGWCRWVNARRRGALRQMLAWAEARGREAMNLSDKMMAKINEAAARYLAKVAAGTPEPDARRDLMLAVGRMLADVGVSVQSGGKFIELIVSGAIGAARASRTSPSPSEEKQNG